MDRTGNVIQRRLLGILGLATVALAAAGLDAQAAPPPRTRGQEHEFHWTVAAGSLSLSANPDLFQGDRRQFSLAGGFGQRIRPYLSLDLGLLYYSGRIDAPPLVSVFGSAADHYDLEAGVLTMGLQVEAPRGSVRPFAGAAGGLYLSKIVRHGTAIFFPFTGTVDEDKDVSPALTLDAGLAFRLARQSSLTIEYRRLFGHARFDNVSDDPIDLGGNLVLLGYRHEFVY